MFLFSKVLTTYSYNPKSLNENFLFEFSLDKLILISFIFGNNENSFSISLLEYAILNNGIYWLLRGALRKNSLISNVFLI